MVFCFSLFEIFFLASPYLVPMHVMMTIHVDTLKISSLQQNIEQTVDWRLGADPVVFPTQKIHIFDQDP
jgi:hypothetical protein